MEQTFKLNVFKSNAIKRVIFAVLVGLATLNLANAETRPAHLDSEIVVSAVGVVQGEMVFNLSFDNKYQDVLEISLYDAEGNRLYQKEITGKSVNKTFKVPSDAGTLYLVVTNKKDSTSKKFQISSRERVIEKLLIGSVH